MHIILYSIQIMAIKELTKLHYKHFHSELITNHLKKILWHPFQCIITYKLVTLLSGKNASGIIDY